MRAGSTLNYVNSIQLIIILMCPEECQWHKTKHNEKMLIFGEFTYFAVLHNGHKSFVDLTGTG